MAALLPSENPGTQYINSDLAFNPRGNILASKTAYGWIELWEVNQGRFLRSIKHSAVNISFAPQGDKIIASGPWQLSLIDANDGSVLNNTPGFVRGDDLVFSPNGESLATGYSAWRVKDGEVLWALKDEKFLGYSPDGKQMITILPQEATVYLRHESDLGLIRQIKLEDPNWVGGYFWTMEGHEHVSDIYVSPNGDYLAAAHSGAGLAVWRLADGKIVPALSRYGFYIVFSPDGSLAAIPSTDRAAINLHRLEDGEIIQTIGWSELLEFSPDSKQIIGIKKDQIEVWRIEDGKLLRRFDVDMKDPVNLAISPDGQLLATTTNDHRIVLIRLDTGTVVHTINGNYWRAERLGFSPDGRMLGANLTDGTVRLWGVAP
ncbi:MAG: WD40 repeat domain-containing protein [Anaerolineae bacterium]|nr:WD40 repeat domain-containing protein [Anaerolineae bacterium]